MITKTVVLVKLAVDGMHNFPKAAELFPEVAFLADRHRHMFHFTLAKMVNHSDRDKEFIMLKRDIIDYINGEYFDDLTRTCEFGSKSCEMLAEELIIQFNLTKCEVCEDGENGSIVTVVS